MNARAGSPAGLGEILRKAFAAGGPILIEAPVTAMPSPWHLMRLTPPAASVPVPPNPLDA